MRPSVWYGACQSFGPGGPIQTFAVICLVRQNPRAKDGFLFSYKDMTETAGPYHHDCPAAILDLLDPPANDYAARVVRGMPRTACAYVAAPAFARAGPGPHGTPFTDGKVEQRFRVARLGSKTMLQRIGDGAFVQITRLMTTASTIEGPSRAHRWRPGGLPALFASIRISG